MKKALITGTTGQDGSYLVELLLDKGYEVHGTKRRSSSFNTERLEEVAAAAGHRPDRLMLHYADLADSSSLTNLIRDIQPDEIYNLGAQSHVAVSFDVPEYTVDVTGVATIRLLEAIRASGVETRFYQASSSEMFGSTPPPQNEETPFHPRSPYGCAKVFSYWATINYREAYGLHASNGILFNHESSRRGETFVTRKITRAVARIVEGVQERLVLGNLDAVRDWGYAPEYVEAMWLMLQQDTPDDYVVATGEAHSVREFVEAAFDRVNLPWEKYVTTDPRYQRPSEVDALIGDPAKAKRQLGWEPKTTFKALVDRMVDEDLQQVRDEKAGRRVRVDI
ncbi:GDP-mannose 4,6-dehydratase [Tessaracoccus sp. OS52]|uniref:GDP-mannose 4,6-dehydratase n=1 Tax=Tessaracoccus sp. OS52 TaxID=2886691 RepID=UPI001D11C542|nr:GDP-mannose 4,6-dehydratase [Tessaracoccus sp. OS52]MCC2594329.1 GDP-mannose 4,6-dehydratase [Tessaracoccus sp. OS52]